MSPLHNCILNKDTKTKPIWIMRQAGRYLPEFRKIREKNTNFVNLCLNESLASEITLQPLKRFNFDAAIIFSDILMLPYGLNQKVEFEKGFGPKLGKVNIDEMSKLDEVDFVQIIFSDILMLPFGLGQELNFIKNFGPQLGQVNLNNFKKVNEIDFTKKLLPIYNAINLTSKSNLMKNKDLIGFVGAPWTLLVYMINKKSPKENLKKDFFNDEILINKMIEILEKFLKLHIKNQIDNGATIIQIFDSWAGILEEKKLTNYVYKPTLNLVNYVKSLGVPVICFPRGIKNYKKFCEIVKPDVVNIDYDVDPKKIKNDINITIQGGLDPKILLSDKDHLKKEAKKYFDIFKDHPYIFNHGHGILPATNPDSVDYLVKLVKDF